MNRSQLCRRIIPCLDVKQGRVVKGVRFLNHRVMGGILDLALSYRDQGADELVFYDITASPQGRSVDVDWVSRVASAIDIPFCVAGGISSVETAERVLNAGADKVSINSPALKNPDLIGELSQAFGQQCIVVGVDSITDSGTWLVKQFTGDPDMSRNTGRKTLDWVQEAINLGAGEIVLNCMDSDGVRSGYDLMQLKTIREVCSVPLIASGGAGSPAHFKDVFLNADVDGALAASVFHSGEIKIPDLKQYLRQHSLQIRTDE